MFERFSKDARTAVQGAVVVAERERSGTIDTRHVLVTLAEGTGQVPAALRTAGLDPAQVAAQARESIRAGDALDGEALAAVGIDLDAVRERTDAVFGEGALDRAGRKDGRRRKHLPFTSDAKKSLELALREAVRLKDRGIESGHLLLGMIRADSPARRLLEQAGADVGELRSAVEQELRTA